MILSHFLPLYSTFHLSWEGKFFCVLGSVGHKRGHPPPPPVREADDCKGYQWFALCRPVCFCSVSMEQLRLLSSYPSQISTIEKYFNLWHKRGGLQPES